PLASMMKTGGVPWWVTSEWNTIFAPFGDHFGAPSSVVVNCCEFDPSASITHRLQQKVPDLRNTIFEPSGDQFGAPTLPRTGVRFTGLEPSAFIVYKALALSPP